MMCLDYFEEIKEIYEIERLEQCYYSLIKDFLKSICVNDERVVLVSDNRDTIIHNRKAYADNGGVPDLIIAPSKYTYENPIKPYLLVEIKAPNILVKNNNINSYKPIRYKSGENSQVNVQLQKIPYVIFTDCLTWYLISEQETKHICLIDKGANYIYITNNNKFTELKKDIKNFIIDAKRGYSE